MFSSLKNTVFFQRFAKEIWRCSHFSEKNMFLRWFLGAKVKKFKEYFFSGSSGNALIKNWKTLKIPQKHEFSRFFTSRPSFGNRVRCRWKWRCFSFLIFGVYGRYLTQNMKKCHDLPSISPHLTLHKIWGGSSETSIWWSRTVLLQ